jgi:hypothetical protein
LKNNDDEEVVQEEETYSPTLGQGLDRGNFSSYQQTHPEDLLGLDLHQPAAPIPTQTTGLFDPSKIGPSSTPIKPNLPAMPNLLPVAPTPTMPVIPKTTPAFATIPINQSLQQPGTLPLLNPGMVNPPAPMSTPLSLAANPSMLTAAPSLQPTPTIIPSAVPRGPSSSSVANPFGLNGGQSSNNAVTGISSAMNGLQISDSTSQGYVPEKSQFLTPDAGNGLEILGTCSYYLHIYYVWKSANICFSRKEE